MKEKIINWLWNYSNKKENSQEEEDFNSFLEDYKKRLEKIRTTYHPKDNDELKQIALSFDNAYSQRKMLEANKGLKNATWILALATILFAVSEVYGQPTASDLVSGVFKTILIIFGVVFIVSVLSILLDIIKKIIRWSILKSPHIFCSNCGQIIPNYEKEGDKKSAITLCPTCINKNGRRT